MKRLVKSLLLVACFAGCSLSAWSQSSTEGKEFWVGLTMAIRPPGDGDGEASPYLAISTKETTTVLFSNPAFPSETFTETIGAFQWKKIEIPQKWWYPSGVGKPSKVKDHADEVNNYGVYVKANKNISVFAIIRAGAGMDASNILPTTALQTEYILQDYIPHAKSGDAPYTTMATILATEDNTEISVNPKGTLLKAATPRLVNNKITLNKGQTYYLMAENNGTDRNCLSGTEITSNKKIAVFQGVPCTFVPHDVGNRDCLYEQAMPIDYWGTEFVATRSYAKGANIIRITASNDNQPTTITVNGQNVGQINRGETYEIELASTELNNMNNHDKKTLDSDLRLIGEFVHIKTSCPAAVYSYDCGKSYTDKGEPELNPDGKQEGDPSSVWIAPMEQSIDQITFGACGTKEDSGNQTKYHYLDIVVETASADQTILYSYLDGGPMDITSSFKPVDGTKYSYARVYLGEADDTKNAAFTVANPNGLVAHVYGNGKSESYSYSVGSAAVEQGVKVNGKIFTNGYRSDEKFCIENEFSFDAKVGTDEITRVDWDFGDGTTDYNGLPQVNHLYSNPGWYDVTAELYGSQVCTNESEQFLGTVTFTFRVVRADTVAVAPTAPYCLSRQEQADTIAIKGQAYLDNLVQNGIITILNPDAPCYEDKQIGLKLFGLETEETKETLTGKDQVTGYNGTIYYESTDVEDPSENRYGCTHHTYYHVEVLHCLQMDITNNPARQRICAGDNIRVAYTKHKGNIDGDAHFIVPAINWDAAFVISEENVTDSLTLPASGINKPGVYQGKVVVRDKNCNEEQTFPIEFNVNYPRDIVAFKFNNVLAVYKPGYGGNDNYTFSAYQWFVNGQAVPNATNSVYHAETPFQAGDIVYVLLTDNNGQSLPSCPLVITSVPDLEPQQQHAPARKLILDQHMFIDRAGTIYDIYGQKVRNR